MTLWIILFILALGTALWLITPFLTQGKKPLIITGFMGLFIAASLGLYTLLGTPVPPSPEELRAVPPMQSVTEADIQAMVEGLAARLAEDPEDPAGWTRLIRSRIVLQDIEELLREHQTMSAHFADRPDIIAQINEQSGFNDLVKSFQR
jgi:hypothetical protein